MIHLSVFLLSLSSIAFEILLTRIFSISQWNHLSFMVISIALFGFAAGGVAIQLMGASAGFSIQRLATPDAISACIVLYSASLLTALLTLNRIPLDYFRLSLEAAQLGYLVLSYLLAALPFFFAGFVISIAFASVPQQSGFVYFVSMAGSALGAVVPALLLPFWDEGRLIVSAGTVPLAAVILPAAKKAAWRPAGGRIRDRTRYGLAALATCVLAAGVYLLVPGGKSLVGIRPSPYKALSQTLLFPDARILQTLTGLHGRIDHVESRFIRFAPGLSLKFTAKIPEQSALFKDGDSPLTLYRLKAPGDLDFARHTTAYAGYSLNPADEKVLIVQSDGGLGLVCALASGKKDIRVVEQDPNIAGLLQRHYKLSVANQNYRAFLARTKERFGIIQIESWGTSLPGSAALDQEHLFTIEAITAYLQHLTANGLIIMARRLLLPPADLQRLWAAAYEALRRSGADAPANHLAVLRNWDTAVLLVAAKPFTDARPIEDFALAKNFDLVYLPGLKPQLANRFNIFEQPYPFIAIRQLAEAYRSGTEKAYFASYPLDIAPQSDRRPFQNSFLKWVRFDEFYKSTGSRLDALFLSGEWVAAAVLVEAIAITLLLLLMPPIFAPKGEGRPAFAQTLYFLSVGAGFMLVEIYFIKAFVFLFGHPLISLTVVLFGMLVFSGFGGYLSRNLNYRALKFGLVALLLTLIGLFLSLDSLSGRIIHLPDYGRYAAAFLLLLPPGVLMGLPFPVGMRLFLNNPRGRANAWAVNGCASVLSTIVAVQIALGIGIPALIGFAALAYAGAFTVMVAKFNPERAKAGERITAG